MRNLQQLLKEYNEGTLNLLEVTPEEETALKKAIADNFEKLEKSK